MGGGAQGRSRLRRTSAARQDARHEQAGTRGSGNRASAPPRKRGHAKARPRARSRSSPRAISQGVPDQRLVHARARRGVDRCRRPAGSSPSWAPPGPGKSTLLHLLGGLDGPTSGDVLLDGKAALRPRRQGRHARAPRIGRLRLPVLQPRARADGRREHRAAAGDRRRGAGRLRASASSDVIAQVGLEDCATKLPSQISGGQQQRTAIARAIFPYRPSSSPTSRPATSTPGPDARSSSSSKTLQTEHGQTIVIVTHDPRAAAYGDEVIYLEDGRIRSRIDLSKRPDADARSRNGSEEVKLVRKLSSLGSRSLAHRKGRSLLTGGWHRPRRCDPLRRPRLERDDAEGRRQPDRGLHRTRRRRRRTRRCVRRDAPAAERSRSYGALPDVADVVGELGFGHGPSDDHPSAEDDPDEPTEHRRVGHRPVAKRRRSRTTSSPPDDSPRRAPTSSSISKRPVRGHRRRRSATDSTITRTTHDARPLTIVGVLDDTGRRTARDDGHRTFTSHRDRPAHRRASRRQRSTARR